MEQPPSKSHAPRREPEEHPKKIEKVVQGEVTARKRSWTRRLKEAFIANRADTVGEFVIWDVFIPAVKNTIVDGATSFVEMMFDDRDPRTRSGSYRSNGPRGGHGSYGSPHHVNYNRMGNPYPGSPPVEPGMSRRGRARHDFKEILIPTRVEAEEVLDQLFRRVVEYNAVTVADLYELCGITPEYTDDKYGWMDIRGSGVIRVRDGFVLDLPRPEPLD